MKYLVLYTEDADTDENEISYDMRDITKIYHDFAKNIYNDADLRKNNLKPLEILTVIDFRDGKRAAYSAMKWEMFFY